MTYPLFEVRHVSRLEKFLLLFHRLHLSTDGETLWWFGSRGKVMETRIYHVKEERLG